MSSTLAGRFLTPGPPETFQVPVWTFKPGLILPHLTFPIPVFSSPVWDEWFPAWVGSSLPGQQVDFYSWEWSTYCTRLEDDYGTVPRQYVPRQALYLSFLKGARITTFSSNALSSSPHTRAQPIPTVGPWQPPLDLLLVLPFSDPSVLSPRLSFKSYCPNEGSRLIEFWKQRLLLKTPEGPRWYLHQNCPHIWIQICLCSTYPSLLAFNFF